jgi:hypothetical protein
VVSTLTVRVGRVHNQTTEHDGNRVLADPPVAAWDKQIQDRHRQVVQAGRAVDGVTQMAKP